MSVPPLATHIVQTLVDHGYIAYFAGGWVRDYLMGHPSSDIDIATDAPPERIRQLFPQTNLVGIAFGVVIVTIQGKAFEVATFRKDIEYADGRKPTRIELATPEEDALRRDFTINGMFYDPLRDIIHDHVQGRQDIEKKVIRTIGNPYERFMEDRLRMIRAVRFSIRFNFHIDPETEEGIRQNAPTLFPAVSMERIWQEFNKMSHHPRFDQALIDLHRLDLLQTIFPDLKHSHLNSIKHAVQPFKDFPPETPTLVYLLQLFPNLSDRKIEEIAWYLKVSRKELDFALHYRTIEKLIEVEKEGIFADHWTWSTLFADPRTHTCLEIVAAKEGALESLLLKWEQKRDYLKEHIERIRTKKPIVNAARLTSEGIKAGPHLGHLLKEAERISINQDLDSPEEIIHILKESQLWKI